MTEGEPFSPFESFTVLQSTQRELERVGYFFYPVAKQHTEAGITDPLAHRLHTLITKRGYAKVAGHVLITFSGYSHDEREVFVVPEIRSFWRTLDAQVPELPGLVAPLPQLGFNGPGLHLLLLGNIDVTIAHPELRRYDIHVADADRIRDDALRRIQQAGRKYHQPPQSTQLLMAQFVAGATHRFRR